MDLSAHRTYLQRLSYTGTFPGSVSFKCGNDLFSGDVLFRLGVGRTDLPGGRERDLIDSIQNTLYTFPDEVVVYSGHGPRTTIGYEKRGILTFLPDDKIASDINRETLSGQTWTTLIQYG